MQTLNQTDDLRLSSVCQQPSAAATKVYLPLNIPTLAGSVPPPLFPSGYLLYSSFSMCAPNLFLLQHPALIPPLLSDTC